MSLIGRLLIVELKTGAMDGMYDPRSPDTANRVAEMLTERHPGSCWVVVEVKSEHGRVPFEVPTSGMWHTNKLGLGEHGKI
jgi:hypothetical protein